MPLYITSVFINSFAGFIVIVRTKNRAESHQDTTIFRLRVGHYIVQPGKIESGTKSRCEHHRNKSEDFSKKKLNLKIKKKMMKEMKKENEDLETKWIHHY